jgi:hypothetical protein
MLKKYYISRIFLFSLFFSLQNKEAFTQINYDHVFNPVQGVVHEREKPFRDELCLNGKWMFMPVDENDSSA